MINKNEDDLNLKYIENNNRNLNWKFPFAPYPKNRVLLSKIESGCERLFCKLNKVDASKLNISEYNKRYFGDKVKTEKALIDNLQLYAYILSWALHDIQKPIKDIVFMDYGGGHGMLALLARETGVGTVIYNDIYDVSCEDAKTIGNNIDSRADYYVHGTIDDVIKFVNKNSIKCDSVGNHDVIEHIYDIEDFIKKLSLLSKSHLQFFFTSGANNRNPFRRKKMIKKHLYVEYNDRVPEFGMKPTDATRALFDVRKDIISKHSPDLKYWEVEELAKLTRGLVKNDIIEAVDLYKTKGIKPKGLSHPTNTCDPYTGNWFEHLMPHDYLIEQMEKNNFVSAIVPGYYSTLSSPVKNIIKKSMNLFIRKSGKYGMIIAPFFAIYGVKRNG